MKMTKANIVKIAFYLPILLLAILYNAKMANAHEYWLETDNYSLESGQSFEANLRNGQEFSGSSFPFVSALFELFEQKLRGQTFAVESEQGSVPAISSRILADGLSSFAFVSKPKSLLFKEFDKFENYLIYEGLERVVDIHRARGLPETDFKEIYQRFAKMLVQVGPPTQDDKDIAHGLLFEWVALDNPYQSTATSQDVRFVLLLEGKPLGNWPFNVFHKTNANGTDTTRQLLKTDPNGIFTLSANRDGGIYMLNAVNLFAPQNNPEFVWGSAWASITFAFSQTNKDIKN